MNNGKRRTFAGCSFSVSILFQGPSTFSINRKSPYLVLRVSVAFLRQFANIIQHSLMSVTMQPADYQLTCPSMSDASTDIDRNVNYYKPHQIPNASFILINITYATISSIELGQTQQHQMVIRSLNGQNMRQNVCYLEHAQCKYARIINCFASAQQSLAGVFSQLDLWIVWNCNATADVFCNVIKIVST